MNSNFGALYFFCYDLGSHRCLTVTNLSKTIMVWEINDANLSGLSDVLKQTLNPDAAQVSSLSLV